MTSECVLIFFDMCQTVGSSVLFRCHINTEAFERATCSLCCYKLNMLTALYIRAGNVADCTVMFQCSNRKMLMSTAVGRVPLLTAVTMITTVVCCGVEGCALG